MRVEIEYSFTMGNNFYESILMVSPSTPDVFYLGNGDPGYPGDPTNIDILKLFMVTELGPELVSDTIKALDYLYTYEVEEIDKVAKDSIESKKGPDY